MKKCLHPNIVELREVLDDTKSNKIYLVLEYLEGGEIKWQSAESKPLMTQDQAREIARDVLSGLEYLHFQGIIHRDIKPANLLRDKDGRVKISDFGVSYASSLDYPDDELELAKTAGTPAFFAPELCVSNLNDPCRPPITSKIDIWAYGVTLYCLLFGKVPFIAESEFELFDVIVKQPLTFPDEELPSDKKPKRKLSDNFPSMFYNKNEETSETSNESIINESPTNDAEKNSRSIDPTLDSVKDLLRHILEKDPSKRYDISDIKHHEWILSGLNSQEKEEFLKVNNDEERIEVTNEEVQKAVYGIAGRIKKHLSRLGSQALHFTGIRRKGSTSSNSSFNQNSSNNTSRSNSVDPPRTVRSRQNSRESVMRIRRYASNSATSERDSLVPPRSGIQSGGNSEHVFSGPDKELLNNFLSQNSSNTSLSSSLSSETFMSSPRTTWKSTFITRDQDESKNSAHSSAIPIKTRSQRAASLASSNDKQYSSDSMLLPEINLVSATSHMTLNPAGSKSSNQNITSLLKDSEFLLNSPLAASPTDHCIKEPGTSRVSSCTPRQNLQSPRSPPSPLAMAPLGSPLCGSVFSDAQLTYEPDAYFTRSPAPISQRLNSNSCGSLESCDSINSSSSSSSSTSDELILNVGSRPNNGGLSIVAQRLTRISDGNLRASSAPISRSATTNTVAKPMEPLPPSVTGLLPKRRDSKNTTSTGGRQANRAPNRIRSKSVAIGMIQHKREKEAQEN